MAIDDRIPRRPFNVFPHSVVVFLLLVSLIFFPFGRTSVRLGASSTRCGVMASGQKKSSPVCSPEQICWIEKAEREDREPVCQSIRWFAIAFSNPTRWRKKTKFPDASSSSSTASSFHIFVASLARKKPKERRNHWVQISSSRWKKECKIKHERMIFYSAPLLGTLFSLCLICQCYTSWFSSFYPPTELQIVSFLLGLFSLVRLSWDAGVSILSFVTFDVFLSVKRTGNLLLIDVLLAISISCSSDWRHRWSSSFQNCSRPHDSIKINSIIYLLLLLIYFSFFLRQIFFSDATVDLPSSTDTSTSRDYDSGRLGYFFGSMAALDLRLALHRRRPKSSRRWHFPSSIYFLSLSYSVSTSSWFCRSRR